MYKLYKIQIINGIPMYDEVTTIYAKNIVEAEFKAMPYYMQGFEYVLTSVKQ